jgi:hypothetical protein
MISGSSIDIQENALRNKGSLLKTLLIDQTTGKNILWGTNSYTKYGDLFLSTKHINPELVTGFYGTIIQPRVIKSTEEQLHRTKDKAEVFTPISIVGKINSLIDQKSLYKGSSDHTWQDYVKDIRMEVACGEAPFIASRYNPTENRGIIKLENRVGFLDQKLKVISRYCINPKQWLIWAKIAFQSSYGFEWQGDSLLIARENLLYTLIDYYQAKFGRLPSLTVQQEFAEIISWNIFQMDGVKYVVPMSCKLETRIIPGQPTLFGDNLDKIETHECEGCQLAIPTKHNGQYTKIMDWTLNRQIRFIDLFA